MEGEVSAAFCGALWLNPRLRLRDPGPAGDRAASIRSTRFSARRFFFLATSPMIYRSSQRVAQSTDVAIFTVVRDAASLAIGQFLSSGIFSASLWAGRTGFAHPLAALLKTGLVEPPASRLLRGWQSSPAGSGPKHLGLVGWKGFSHVLRTRISSPPHHSTAALIVT